MMTLYVLGSGSRGNCCAVEAEGVALLIDAGFSAREVERRAMAVGLDPARLVGIALTHEHGDHSCGASLLARRLRIPVLTTPGTWGRLAVEMEDVEHRPLGLCAGAELGPFTVEACPTSHDAAEPLAIVVRDPKGTSIGVAYDLGRPTTAVRYLLRDMKGAPELHSPERPSHLDPGSRGRVAPLTEVGQHHDGQAGVVELGQELGGRTVGEMAA